MMKYGAFPVAWLVLSLHAVGQSIIYSGVGFGTYYYDIEQVQACGTDFEFQNLGFVECNYCTGLSLDQVNSNYVVAMNHTQLTGGMALYCGKKVVVSVNGVQSSLPLFIGDGCQRCGTGSSSNTVWNSTGAPGLDFSYTVLSELSSNACTNGHIDITWEIVNETLYDFDTNAPGSPVGPVTPGSPPPTTLFTMTSTATPTSTNVPGIPKYGQCGGQGYTGLTQCAAPLTCVVISPWWSQCD